MSRSIFTRSVLAASFCVLAFAQSAFASGDVNDDHIPAGREYKAAKKSGFVCPFANKSSRYEVAAGEGASESSSSSRTSGARVRR